MKKLLVIMTALLIAVAISGCKKEEPGKFDKPDGQYFAIADNTTGYKYYTVVTIENKKITDVEWNAYNVDGGAMKCLGADKYECAKDGNYGMESRATKGEWDVQADNTTNWIVKNQKVKSDITFTDGKTDAISTVSITTEELFDLITEALASTAVVKGDYEDGYYYVETPLKDKTVTYAKPAAADSTEFVTFTETFKTSTFGSFLVVNGTIVVADFNARHDAYTYVMADGKFATYTYPNPQSEADFLVANPTKTAADYKANLTANKVDGTFNAEGVFVPTKKYLTKDSAGSWYGMSNVPNIIEWDVQTKNVEAKFLADQGFTVTDGAIDGLTGASIHVNGFIDVVNLLLPRIE